MASGGRLVSSLGVPCAIACMLPIPRAIATIIDVASTIPAMISHLGPLWISPYSGFASGAAVSGCSGWFRAVRPVGFVSGVLS